MIHAVMSVIFGISLAVLLVEKGDAWPITIITKPLHFILSKIYSKAAAVLECTVCCSFWCAGVGDLALYFLFTHTFMWPFTGVISLGVTWLIIEYLNAIDKK